MRFFTTNSPPSRRLLPALLITVVCATLRIIRNEFEQTIRIYVPESSPRSFLEPEHVRNHTLLSEISSNITVSVDNFPLPLDPMALRRSIEASNYSDYFDLLRSHREDIRANVEYYGSSQHALSAQSICGLAPGRGMERDGGFKILKEKLQIASVSSPPDPRLFCGMYTYGKMHDLARVMALSWGVKCDGFVAFTTEDIPDLGFVKLKHEGPESYNNMWQKVRSIWLYIYENYRDDFDFFHLSGDDTYLITENMRAFLRRKRPDKPLFFGEGIPYHSKIYAAGGPGYTLSQATLSLLDDVLSRCHATKVFPAEDRLISRCIQEVLNIPLSDTRDEKGEQRYHDCDPNHLFHTRSDEARGSFHANAGKYFATLDHPGIPGKKVGPKHGLDAASSSSVSFHDVYHPSFAARLHVLVYPTTCPKTSVLGRSLQKLT